MNKDSMKPLHRVRNLGAFTLLAVLSACGDGAGSNASGTAATVSAAAAGAGGASAPVAIVAAPASGACAASGTTASQPFLNTQLDCAP
ncbi:hypothetical protein G3N59_02185 [Paraburkholderia sp. Ac-20340]|uniref:hypothetical protein n=1 Tax=Paraburkholderia sp. Ac-20340 TaxID=2703888 RepID=UPI00197F9A0E|nr:hypothetical protein [Paraburkholderia sp. Ac-20340]MBN3852181.1 hypothetical protein [Paraburkholderia sp. Ac-20340]